MVDAAKWRDPRPVLDALSDKLREADFFLGRLEEAEDPILAGYYFSAFSSASRSVTFVMQATMSCMPDFEGWYQPHRARLAGDPVARMMLEQRNILQKECFGGILGGATGPGRGTTFRFDQSFLFLFGIGPTENGVVELSGRYMAALTHLVAACLDHYWPQLDPHTYLTVDCLKKQGLTPEDIEERKGFQRGWTRLSSGEDEWRDRLFMLASTDPPWPNVDDIMKKRVKANRRNASDAR